MTSAKLTIISQRGAFLLRKAHEIAAHSKPDTGDVDTVLILATAGVEAFLNGLERLSAVAGVDAEGRLESLGQLLQEAEKGRAQLALKYELAHFVLSGRAIDRGSSTYQAFARLCALRNDLIHPKPISGRDPAKLVAHAHVEYFLTRGIIGREDLRGHVTWDRAVLRPAVAHWAYATALRTVVEIIDLMPQCLQSDELRRCWPDNLPAHSSHA